MHYSDSVLARNAWQIMVLSAHADIATPMKQEYLHNNINNINNGNKKQKFK